MPIPELEGKSGPLTATEIHIVLLKIGRSVSDLAVDWDVPKENISRVINRTPEFSFPDIRQRFARLFKCPVAWIGREPSDSQKKRAATLARKGRVARQHAA